MNRAVLLADIGGTNIRLAISTAKDAPLKCIESMRCADFDHPLDAVRQYLHRAAEAGQPSPDFFCLAVAAAIRADLITLTNNHWQFSQRHLSQALNMPVKVVNDLEAQAWCLTQPQALSLRWLNQPDGFECAAPASWPRGTRTIAGTGTGFGAAYLTPGGEVRCSEPGHMAFAPLCETDVLVLQQLWRWYPRVSVEHLISGPGIANIFCALTGIHGQQLLPAQAPSPAEIAGMAGHNLTAQQTLQFFSRCMGAVCGDLALAQGSQGGFFISGSLLTKLGQYFDDKAFMNSFTDKLMFRQWCEAVPVACVQDQWPGLIGCCHCAYSALESGPGL